MKTFVKHFSLILCLFILLTGCVSLDNQSKMNKSFAEMILGEDHSSRANFLNESGKYSTDVPKLSIDDKGGELEISFKTSYKWSASVANTGTDWVTISQPSGYAGNATIKVTVTKNKSTEERSTVINIKTGDYTYHLKVTQKAGFPYLCLTAVEPGTIVYLKPNKDHFELSLLYSTDAEQWEKFDIDNTKITLDAEGDRVFFKADKPNTRFAIDWSNYYSFTTQNGMVDVSGNIMYLLDGSNPGTVLTEANDYAFVSLFEEMNIRDAKDLILPATSLSYSCYNSMFYNCYSLRSAPELPATQLTPYCYQNMFINTRIETAPELPALVAVEGCYDMMFEYCSSLKIAPELPALQLEKWCYEYMFEGCTSLTQAPKQLPATQLAKGCYEHMFQGCTSLTQAPELPATQLANSCYSSMFQGCTSLTQAPELPALQLENWCYYYMFYGCTSLTQAPALPATILGTHCYRFMFYGCTSLTQAPALPATNLKEQCYQNMFNGCTSLTKAPDLPATQLSVACYEYMFEGCTSLIKAPVLPATKLLFDGYCYHNMFNNCISLNSITVLAIDIVDRTNLNGFLSGCATTGTLAYNPNTNINWIDYVPSGWNIVSAPL